MNRRFLCVLFIPCACNAPASDASVVQVRDSSGITIVESRSPTRVTLPRWHIAPQPTLEIGERAGDAAHDFQRIAATRRLSSGGVVVVDAGAHAVSYFDSMGTLVGRVGRRGGGPGEFAQFSVQRVLACGQDTVWIHTEDRLASYSPPGRFLGSVRLQAANGGSATPIACGVESFVGIVRHGRLTETEGIQRSYVTVGLYSRAGRLVAALDTVPFEDRVILRTDGRLGNDRRYFGPHLAIAANAHWIALGFGDRFEIEYRDAGGSLRRSVRVIGRQRPLHDSIVSRLHERTDPLIANDAGARRLRDAMLEPHGLPNNLPAFTALRFDARGNLWARMHHMADEIGFALVRPGRERPSFPDPQEWIVLDSAGILVAAITLPARFELHDIGDDWVLGVWRDELDVQYVRLHELERPEGPAESTAGSKAR